MKLDDKNEGRSKYIAHLGKDERALLKGEEQRCEARRIYFRQNRLRN